MNLNRRQFISSSSVTVIGGLVAGRLAAGQQPPAPATPKFETVRGSAGIFTARGGTIGYVVVPDGVVVVDSQFPDTARQLLDGLKERTNLQIDVLINTHHHGDHTGGNLVLRPATKTIVAHARVPELQKAAAVQAKTEANQAYPDLTLDKEWSATVGGYRVSAKHYGPAHTGGDIAVHFEKDNVVHMGDLMFHQRHPFIDRPAGASIRNWITTLEAIANQHGSGTTYIFGHAKQGLPLTGGRPELLQLRDYFTAVLEHVQKGLAASKSREEITALGALTRFEGYQEAPPRLTLAGVLGVAHDELTSKS
jgi:cyclase